MIKDIKNIRFEALMVAPFMIVGLIVESVWAGLKVGFLALVVAPFMIIGLIVGSVWAGLKAGFLAAVDFWE